MGEDIVDWKPIEFVYIGNESSKFNHGEIKF